MKYFGFSRLITSVFIFLSMTGCNKLSDEEIGGLIENVLGHEIPNNYQVKYRLDSHWFAKHEASQYRITFSEVEFKEFFDGINLTEWNETGEVFEFKSASHPHETVILIPTDREINYSFFWD